MALDRDGRRGRVPRDRDRRRRATTTTSRRRPTAPRPSARAVRRRPTSRGGTPLVAMARFQDRHRADRVTRGERGKPARPLGVGAERTRSAAPPASSTPPAATARDRARAPRTAPRARGCPRPTRRAPRARRARASPTRAISSQRSRSNPTGSCTMSRTRCDGARPQHEVATGRREHLLFVRQGEVHGQLGARQAQAALGDHVLLHLERARGDGGRDVALPVPADLARERCPPVPTVELRRRAQQLEPDLADELLELAVVDAGDRGLGARHLTRVLQRDGPVVEEARRLVADPELGQLPTDVGLGGRHRSPAPTRPATR